MPLNSFEESILNDYKNDRAPKFENHEDLNSLTRFSIWLMLNIGKLIRSQRILPQTENTKYKSGGSPVTKLELEIELYVRKTILEHFPQIQLVGEETGGNLLSNGLSFSLDPIDGTWSFITHSDSYATSLALFDGNEPIVGVVLNSATGEMGYVKKGDKTRLLQISIFGEGDNAIDLPSNISLNDKKILINIHPSKRAKELIKNFYNYWETGEINMIKSVGGSPALALLEASKGYYTYINLWDKRPALSYDLAAGVLLIRGAGGDVLDFNNTSIEMLDHQGPFIGGTSPQEIKELTKFLKVRV